MLNTHAARFYTVSAMAILLLVMIVVIVRGMYLVNRDIASLQNQIQSITDENLILERFQKKLEAEINLSMQLGRLSTLQKAHLPDVKIPQQIIRLEDLPYLNSQNSSGFSSALPTQ